MNKAVLKDSFLLCCAFVCAFLYLPHFVFYFFCDNKRLIDEDILANNGFCRIKKLPRFFCFLFLLHSSPYFRTLFYYRIGPVRSIFLCWYRPGAKYFHIPYSTIIGGGLCCVHPWCTTLNAEKIGRNFNVKQNTTIGISHFQGRSPRIGDDVDVGCNAVIIGDIVIGNNVTIGAGSVVVKSVPDNAVAVGNPAKVIKYKNM